MPRTSRLSIELLQTFLCLLKHENLALVAAELGINQPSLSKRLACLQHPGRDLARPWLRREGRTWGLTLEGQRVLATVRDIVRRYERLSASASDTGAGLPLFTFACGQQAATGFVLRAARRFHREQPGVAFRISQRRGQARIEGVANGSLDLAAVTDREETIAAVARCDLHVDALPEEPLLLVAARPEPGGDSAWYPAFARLPQKGVPAEALRSFPLIVPEPDAGVRRVIDAAAQAAGILSELDVVLEVGGWQAILAYVRAGLGVGVVTQTALEQEAHGLERRWLNRKTFPPQRVRLICRKRSADPNDLDLSPPGARFRELLLEEGRWRCSPGE